MGLAPALVKLKENVFYQHCCCHISFHITVLLSVGSARDLHVKTSSFHKITQAGGEDTIKASVQREPWQQQSDFIQSTYPSKTRVKDLVRSVVQLFDTWNLDHE